MSLTTLSSPDRELFGTIIRQSTDGMFCVSDFTTMYESMREKKGWSHKNFQDIFSNKKSAEQIFYTLESAKIIDSSFNEFMKIVDEKGLLKTLKDFGLYKTRGKAENRFVWANPYIFVFICMEMNPEIYGKIVTWLTDQLIFNRIEASQNWKPMTDSILNTLGNSQWNFTNTARWINTKVFGKPDAGQRAIATQKELAMIRDVEKHIANLCKLGLIKSQNDIKTFVEKYDFL